MTGHRGTRWALGGSTLWALMMPSSVLASPAGVLAELAGPTAVETILERSTALTDEPTDAADDPIDQPEAALVPTPGAAALLGLGGLVVASRRRRR